MRAGDSGLDPARCRDIVRRFGAEMNEGRVGTEGIIDPISRSSEMCWVEDESLSATLFDLIVATNREQGWDLHLDRLSRVQLSAYDSGDLRHYDFHLDLDRHLDGQRKLTLIAQLSDPADHRGGLVQLMRSHVIEDVPLDQGDVVIFPSFVLHRVTPVVHGRRCSLVAWGCGDRLR